MRTFVPTLVIAAAALAVPSAASAATAAGGTTDLTFAVAASKALKSAGIKVSPVGTAPEADGSIPFPVTGTSGGSTLTGISHSGGLKLKRGARALTITDFKIVVKSGAPTAISAKAGKARVVVFTLGAKKTKVATDGLDTTIAPVVVNLSAVGAAAIKSTLGVKLPTGYKVGFARVTLESAATRVSLDSGTAAALTSLGLSVAPESPAVAGSTIQFPITNAAGKVSLDAPITHSGGLVFTGGGKSLTVGDFTIDPKAGLLYAERTPVGRLPLFKVDLSAAAVTTPGIQVRVAGAKLSLTKEAAAALNATFGVTALTEGLAIGTAQIVALA